MLNSPLAGASKVLVVCLDNIGDLIWAGALASQLKRALPSRTVGLWSKSYASGVTPFIPDWDCLHTCDPFWESSPGGTHGTLGAFKKTLSEIADVSYDAAVIVNSRWKVCAAVRWTGINERVGFAQRGSTPWLTRLAVREDRSREVLDEWSRLLTPFMEIEHRPLPILRVPESYTSRQKEIASSFIGSRVAILHPSAGDPRRCAPQLFWRDLASGLEDAGFSLGWIGRSDELEPLRAVLGKSAESHLWVDKCGSGSLQDSLLMTASASLFIGHDSGPLHAAAGFGVPSIGLYLPGDWPRARPTGKGPIRVFRHEDPADLDSLAVLRAAKMLTSKEEATA